MVAMSSSDYENIIYYMAGSVSRKDEPNCALWLVNRAGKMELSCPLQTTSRTPWENFLKSHNYNESFIDQAFSVKIAGYWPRFFDKFMDFDSISVHKHAKKELGQYPAILTSHFVNNPPFIFPKRAW